MPNKLLHTTILGTGNPIVILHGFLGMSDNWKSIGMQFMEQGYQVHLVDQRNHGHSFHEDTFNYEVMAEDLHVYCTHYNLKNSVIIGHSMGGKTAMQFAVNYPELISKLIVADISPRYYPVHHETILEGLSALNFEVLKSRTEAEKVLSNYVLDIGTRQFLLKNLYWIEPGKLALRMHLKALINNIDEVGKALPNTAKYLGETLFLKGDRSEYIKPEDEMLIKLHFPHSKIKNISQAGHWLHADNPSEFFKAVIQFIA